MNDTAVSMPPVVSVLPMRLQGRQTLRSCAHCGGPAEIRLDLRFRVYRYVGICEVCGATGESSESVKKAAFAWNRRAT